MKSTGLKTLRNIYFRASCGLKILAVKICKNENVQNKENEYASLVRMVEPEENRK